VLLESSTKLCEIAWQTRKLSQCITKAIIAILEASLAWIFWFHARIDRISNRTSASLFDLFAQRQGGQISFDEFLSAISLFAKSTRAERLRLAFRYCDYEKQNKVKKTDLTEALIGFEHLYYGMRKKSLESASFCDMAFEKFGSEKNFLTWEEFSKIAPLHPLLVSYFRLDVLNE